jgi:hypothetical protein
MALAAIPHGSSGLGNYAEIGLPEINSDLLEADIGELWGLLARGCSLYDNHQSGYAEHEWSPKFR